MNVTQNVQFFASPSGTISIRDKKLQFCMLTFFFLLLSSFLNYNRNYLVCGLCGSYKKIFIVFVDTNPFMLFTWLNSKRYRAQVYDVCYNLIEILLLLKKNISLKKKKNAKY